MEAAEERGLMVAGGEKERERAEPKGQKGEGRVLSSVPFVHKKIIHTLTLQPVHLIFSPFHIKILI